MKTQTIFGINNPKATTLYTHPFIPLFTNPLNPSTSSESPFYALFKKEA